MENDWNSITSGQLMTFIVSSQIGIGILILPSTLAKDVGHDGWLVVLLSGVLFSGLTVLMILFLKRFGGKSLIEINRSLYGKYLSYPLSILYIIYVFFGAVVTLRAFSDMQRITILKSTPLFALTLLSIMPAVYMTWYGLKVISRFGTVIYFILFSAIILYFLSIGDYRIDFILPVGDAGIPAIIKATFGTTMSFLGPELTLFIYSDIKDKNKTLKYALFGNLVTTLFYTSTVLILTLFFGKEMLPRLVFPLLSFSGSHKAFVFERFDLLFVSLWMPSMGTTMLSYLFCSYYGLCNLLGINTSNRIVTKGRVLIFISIFAVAAIISMLPEEVMTVWILLNILGYVGMGIIILTIISYLISFVMGRKS